MFKYAKLYAHKKEDSTDLAFQKQLLVIICSVLFLCGIVWWLMWYLIFGWSIPAIAAGLFGIMVLVMIIVSHHAKNHLLLVHSVFLGTIVVPVTCQWALGSLHESGMIIAWAFLTPLGILIFTSIRPAIIYMGIFVVCILITVIFEPNFSSPPLVASEATIKLFYTMNLLTSFSVIFATCAWFVNIIKKTISSLRTTQKQLIQSEKMASLGELTAGIAHEIQNPLNFVNNFSEVSMELIEEVSGEMLKGKSERSEKLEIELLDDISQNLQKISHHGKRADSIVKGMLQHRQASSSIKVPTDINKLADEYLRLAYHGQRSKDTSFNAELQTNFDRTIPLVNMVSQDIGRALLNLFTNAFYATQQRFKANKDFQPGVILTTNNCGDFIEIKVWDNGIGIPDSIKDKILQPFFTTKPAGEGTGLGLSLSYDIVVKGHSGKIDVRSIEGEYTEFTICIPA